MINISSIKNKFLNKNFILFIIFFILLIVAIILFLILSHNKKIENSMTTFSSDDSSVSLSVYDTYSFSKVDDDSYLLSLKSEKIGSTIYISQYNTNNIRDINKFIEADKNDYIAKFPNITDVSDISEFTINNTLQTYNYNFKYKDNMFVDVYWILKDSTFYVIDFNMNSDVEDLSSRINEILNSISFN
jgi:hypothetical protein